MENSKYLILVNRTHPVKGNILDHFELVQVENAKKEIISVEKKTAEAYQNLKKD